jgi:hypothetical protein
MGVLDLNEVGLSVVAVMFDKDTVVTMQNLAVNGFIVPADPFPCKAHTPYAFNCDSVLLAEADVTVGVMINPKAPHGKPLSIFTFDFSLLVE